MTPLERLDLNLLLLLDWLLKERNVTRAAERMGISQPAGSRGLQKLRREFGDELLVRTGRRYALTKFASELQGELSAAIGALRALKRKTDTFCPAEASGAVSIACNDYLAAVGARCWSAQLAPHAPGLTSSWRPLDGDALNLLASGQLDLVLAPEAALSNIPAVPGLQDLVIKPLMEDRFVLFGAPDHPLMTAETLTLEALATAERVRVSPQGRGEGMVDRALSDRGFDPAPGHRSWSFNHAADLALQTQSVAVLPERLAVLFSRGAVRALPLELAPVSSLIVWHASRTGDAAHRWVRSRLRAGFEQD
jgi:DNA-binding transcriptional LysR family regulator